MANSVRTLLFDAVVTDEEARRGRLDETDALFVAGRSATTLNNGRASQPTSFVATAPRRLSRRVCRRPDLDLTVVRGNVVETIELVWR